MANEDLRVRITAQIQGLDAVESLKNAVRQLQGTAAPAAADLQKLKNAAMQLGSATDRTENDLRRSINALKDVRAQLAVTGTEYKNLTKTINDYQRALDKATGTERGGGGSRTGQAIGAIASGAIFGGPEGGLGGLLGAGIGAATGGGAVAGAFAGAAVGATAGLFRQQITGAADYAGELARMRIALKGVSTDQEEFNKSLSFISKTAPQFLMSVGDATKNYTKLQASVRGAGMGVDETQKVFQGLSAAIVATGGGTEQLNGAMLAATQVFSKGKVSAEELRGQIGERLPGAFTIFAQAVKMTPQQLDKALEQGKISTEDFVTFAQELYKRYGESAKAIGDSPFAASVRFQIAMDNFRNAAGTALIPIISAFQNFGTESLNALTRVAEGTTSWQKALGNTFDNVSKLIGGVQGLKNILSGLTKTLIVLGTTMAGVFAVQNIGMFAAVFKTVVTTTSTLVKITRELLTLEKAITALKAIQAGLQAFISGAGTSLKRNAKGIAGGAIALGAGAAAAYTFRDEIDKAIGGVVDGLGKQFESIFKMPELGGNFGGQNQPLPPDAGNQEQKDKETKEEQARQEALAKADIELKNRVHQNAMELIRRRYEYELELQNKAADNWTKGYTGAARSAAGVIARALQDMESLRGRRREAEMDVMNAQQALKSARQMASVTASGLDGAIGGRYIQGGIGPRGANTYGPHFDIKRSDRGYFDRTALDEYVRVNGMPLSSGLTVPGGRFGAPRSYGPHAGWDYAFGGNAALTLANGAKWIGSSSGENGDEAAFMTPDGKVYKIIHGRFEAAPGTKVGAGGALERRNINNAGEVAEASANLAKAEAFSKLTKDQTDRLQKLLGAGFAMDITEPFREQTAELERQNRIQELRNKLFREGASPEFIDGEVRKAEALQQFNDVLQPANDKLAELRDKFKETKDANIAQDIALLETFVKALKDQFPQLTAQLDLFLKKQKEARDLATGFNAQFTEVTKNAYKEAMNLGGQLGNTFVGAINGMADALTQFTMTGKLSFADLARSIIADINRMIFRYLIFTTIKAGLNAVSPGLGGKIFGNAKGNAFTPAGVVPFAMGGIVDKPTLFKFANGGALSTGVMGEAGPEAIIPLRRGRDGKLGVAGGGSNTSVVVNVDASGSQVQGDSGNAEQLGRAVSQAVQAELIKQKRPGGLLAA